MRDTTAAGQYKSCNEPGGVIEDQAEQPGARCNADKEMSDHQKQAAAFAPFALRAEVTAQILDELLVLGADFGHRGLLMQVGNTPMDRCRFRDGA